MFSYDKVLYVEYSSANKFTYTKYNYPLYLQYHFIYLHYIYDNKVVLKNTPGRLIIYMYNNHYWLVLLYSRTPNFSALQGYQIC